MRLFLFCEQVICICVLMYPGRDTWRMTFPVSMISLSMVSPTSFLVAGRGHISSLPVAAFCVWAPSVCPCVRPSALGLLPLLGWCTECCHDHWGSGVFVWIAPRPGKARSQRTSVLSFLKTFPAVPVVQVLIYLPTNSVEAFP